VYCFYEIEVDMVRLKVALLLIVLLCAAGFLISLNGCGGVAANHNPPPPPPGKINHVVIIFQENRTPDNLFHDPVLISRGADIASSGKNSSGQTIQLTPAPLVTEFNLAHSHQAFLSEWDNGAMDGADRVGVNCPPGNPNCAPPNPWFQYVQASDVQPYFTLAETYTFGDRMFLTNQGPSFPAHQYIISGTSAITEKSNFSAAENPLHIDQAGGCIAPPSGFVKVIDTTNFDPTSNEKQAVYPCFEHPTLTDLLDAKSINWKYYAPVMGSIWTGPNAIQHICGPNAPPPNGTDCIGAVWTNHVVISKTRVLDDISTGKLAAVSWVIPTNQSSDHPSGTDGTGPSWVASVVSAIGTSQYWKDTAIIITWDDWGGWFDHVIPPNVERWNSRMAQRPDDAFPEYNGQQFRYGSRVPCLVVSPYAKRAHVSRTLRSHISVVKFCQTLFGLPPLHPRLATADDLTDCFDPTQHPLPPPAL